ncbi:MAG: hypothetical protein M0Z52_08420 [Actinomycetota bacterium]|nr:hypothetical protein [Actinomycetota bacterium]
MKKIIIIAIILVLAMAGILQAADKKPPKQSPQPPAQPNQPISYGDACDSPYGMCQSEITMREAVHALNMYFAKRGLICRIRMHLGRFVKADIYNGNAFVDSIILDRKTGKMRSIY